MPLLVVPLAPGQEGLLTLTEWDRLLARRHVWFERPDHPLLPRLQAAGVDAGPLEEEPDASSADVGLVADPASRRVLDLARAGADVTAGAANPPDALTAAHASAVVRRAGASLSDLAAVMARLRSEDGCPWDREQTHDSLKVHLLEETHEVIEAIERGELGDELEEELGDVLLQVAFHSRLAAQDERFDLADVANRIVAKLIGRHPHVFADTVVADAAEVLRNWEAIKAGEKERSDPFDGIPSTLPALLSAAKVQKRAGNLGFQPGREAVIARARDAAEALGTIDQVDEERIGELLFWAVAVARCRGIDPEGALRKVISSFKQSL